DYQYMRLSAGARRPACPPKRGARRREVGDRISGVGSANGASHGLLQETPTRTSRDGHAPVARRAGPADLREHLRRRLEALGRTDEDDPQRVPADAPAE